MARHIIATADEIPPGGKKVVTVKGREIVVFNVKGEYFAILNRCPHEGAKMCSGALVGLLESDEPGEYKFTRPGELLRCPWHGWEFDLRTGQSYCDPDKIKVRSFPTDIERGGALVEGPYVAETFTVSVEKDYVLVSL